MKLPQLFDVRGGRGLYLPSALKAGPLNTLFPELLLLTPVTLVSDNPLLPEVLVVELSIVCREAGMTP